MAPDAPFSDGFHMPSCTSSTRSDSTSWQARTLASIRGAGDSARDAQHRVAQIEAELPTLRRDSANVLEMSTEGTTIIADYRGRELRRLQATFLGESGRAEETYYFDPSLIQVNRRESVYDAPLSGQIEQSTARRYVFLEWKEPTHLRDSLMANARALLAALAQARQ